MVSEEPHILCVCALLRALGSFELGRQPGFPHALAATVVETGIHWLYVVGKAAVQTEAIVVVSVSVYAVFAFALVCACAWAFAFLGVVVVVALLLVVVAAVFVVIVVVVAAVVVVVPVIAVSVVVVVDADEVDCDVVGLDGAVAGDKVGGVVAVSVENELGIAHVVDWGTEMDPGLVVQRDKRTRTKGEAALEEGAAG
jgi:hypothetical protein